MTEDEKYMKECFKLALKGKGKVTPNPMVGCIVLNKNGKVIAKGYSPKLFHQDLTLSRSFPLGIPQAIWLGLLSLNQDLDFVEVFHVRNTSNELGFALT
jgi:hypothetical protein